MHRSFDPSRTRTRRYLDGRWEFVTDPDDDLSVDGFPANADELTVPSAWNARPEYVDYEGTAWYRRTFHLGDDSTVRLAFEAVAHEATVYLDGEKLVDHYGGYTPFDAVVPDLAAGDHELVVRVDNVRDETSVPKPGSDWHTYGGITREVFVEEVPDVFVEDVDVSYDLDGEGGYDGESAEIAGSVTVRNVGEEATVPVSLTVGGQTVERTVSIPAGSGTVTLTTTLEGVERWSPENPELYTATATAGDDEYRDRVGFRTVSVDGTDILVNGDPVMIEGVNRHEDHPDWGHAQPARLMDRDLDLIERAGLDAVRTSHYPNHPRFLDYCDEAGMLVIEEIPYWQFNGEHFHREDVLDRGKRMLTEMIGRDRHHPSVFAWSVHNECATHEEGVYDATTQLVDHTHELDDTRLVTYASNRDFEGLTDECFDLVDFMCINGYWGWYSDERGWTEFLEEVHESYEEKPIVVSEFGAGAVPGEKSTDVQKWSEPYQREVLEETIETFRENELVAGYTIWQYCDTRAPRSKTMRRPRKRNNKGILDEYRRPKESYWAIKDLLTE